MESVMSDSVNLGASERRKVTDKAMLVFVEDLGEEVWVPKSAIHDDSEVYDSRYEGEEGDLIVKSWLARDRGWV